MDMDKEGTFDNCGAEFEADDGEVCICCGEVHDGFFKDVVYALHKLFYKIGGEKSKKSNSIMYKSGRCDPAAFSRFNR